MHLFLFVCSRCQRVFIIDKTQENRAIIDDEFICHVSWSWLKNVKLFSGGIYCETKIFVV